MAEREPAISIKAHEEVASAIGKVGEVSDEAGAKSKTMFGGMTAAAKEARNALETVKGSVDSVLGGIGKVATKAKIEDFSKATDALRTFNQDALDLNKSFSKVTDEFISQMDKFPKKRGEDAAGEKKPSEIDVLSHERMLTTESEFFQRRFELSTAYHEAMSQQNEDYGNKSTKIEEQTWNEKARIAGYAAGNMANIMQNLFVLTGSKNRAMFETMKAFAIAETIIQTYRAAQGAYAAMANIPVVGPALGVAAAAAAIASGMARVKQMSSMQPGGATGTISSGGHVGGSMGAYPAPAQEEPKQTQNITLQIYNPLSQQNWAEIAENNIMPALKAASDRNIVMNVKTAYA